MSERVRPSATKRVLVAVARARRTSRGFTLLELMVVVLLIGILAVLALPSMGMARYDRHAYEDAGAITQLFRTAKTRAIARGAAQLIHITEDQAANHGRFELWEAVAPNSSGAGANRTPVSSCKTPTRWTLSSTDTSGTAFIDAVDLNGAIEQSGSIYSQALDPTTSLIVKEAFLCYTPLGRVYYSAGANANFDAAGPMTGVLQVQVLLADATLAKKYRGPLRTIVVPGAGMARLVSK